MKIIFVIIKKHIINPDPEGGDREFRDNLHGTDYLVGHQWLASLGRTHAPSVSHCNVHVIGLEGSWEDVWFDRWVCCSIVHVEWQNYCEC